MSIAADSPEQAPVDPTRAVRNDTDVADLWDLAAWIGMISPDDHLHSFTSLLIALLHTENGLSRWFLRYAQAAGISLDAIYASREFRPAILQEIKTRRATDETPSGKPGWTNSATTIVKGAIELKELTHASELGVRHVLGSYLFALPTAHVRQIAEWQFDLPTLASAFVRQMRTRYRNELPQWQARYKQTFGKDPDLDSPDPPTPSRISGFDSDTPEGDDQLNIEDDVYALSALICSTRVTPPLSIGLFGDWGSGKSFFIRQLQRGVRWISADARGSERMQKDTPFYKYVVQIEFNAWNYSGGNLWAALVQHILEHMRLLDDHGNDLVAAHRNELKQQMDLENQVREATTKKKDEAQTNANAAKKQLTNLRNKHEKEVQDLKVVLTRDVLGEAEIDPGMTRELNTLRGQLGLPEAAANANDFLAALEGTRSLLRRSTAVFSYVPKGQRIRFFVTSGLVVLVPPAVALGLGVWAQQNYPGTAGIATIAGWFTTTAPLATQWLRQRTAQLDIQVAKLEGLQAHARQRVEAKQQEFRADAAQLEQQIALAKDEILVAQSQEAEAASRLQQIQTRLDATTPASVLADYVQDRFQSEDYRRHLGLPAVISRDFSAISSIIKQENDRLAFVESLEEERENSAQRINRIVLYIDDLDRCPEDLVVEVLQAVHLLLAFPLFVVVVAVDARWVSRSLAHRFPGLLTKDPAAGAANAPADDTATPNDYLEKIFQIPFWLRPPGEAGVTRMLQSLIGETVVPPARDIPITTPPTPKTPPAPAKVFKRRQHDPVARSLEIQQEEREYIALLAPLLDRTPRGVKRFVNVYRLLKASLPPEHQDLFLEPGGPLGAPYRTVLLLLAAVTGLPACGDALVERVLAPQKTSAKTPPILGVLIADMPTTVPTLVAERDRLVTWLDRNHAGAWRTIIVDDGFRDWMRRVARYSYRPHRSATD